ncbi:acylphosphatase-1-like isoform X1 [Hemicordylus capensis]|uniref:acylphosphatase-1-like isoform X1 n=1 Tax=Hemicordylus capensis TaxID=884348 RepID=UPI002302262E|nr:acylphosphatase-1-like isoform X1 [Hemicordylus capensis]XP_053133634.1 acylphosphatase-1-like isoform X1 [Hemicordylus capensis]XP_053133635.1 acylphosphatase-1-like isoform X1 [Hemicordylus capensis]XP_053133636.1 acylphosphatase-1-like isoform X1 [Hemicordylus capensis]
MASPGFWALDYEVYGDVQGVFFRKYTEEQGRKLGVVGWVKNTAHGTVTGQVQGPKEKVEIIYEAMRTGKQRCQSQRKVMRGPVTPAWIVANAPVSYSCTSVVESHGPCIKSELSSPYPSGETWIP